MSAVLTQPVEITELDRPEPCTGILIRRSTGVERPCPNEATYEALRTCHGDVKRTVVCDPHANCLIDGTGGRRCGTCEAPTVVLVAIVPLGGARR